MNIQIVRSWLLATCIFYVVPVTLAQSGMADDPEAPLPAATLRPSTPILLKTKGITTPVSTIKVGPQRLGVGAGSIVTSVKSLLTNVTGLRVEDSPLEIGIILESDVLFDFDRWDLRLDATKNLTVVSEALGQFKGRTVRLIGHADSKGEDGYNLTLSLNRAESVRRFFVDQAHLRDLTLAAEGRGEREPAVSNTHQDGSDDPAGRQKNRRVEIRIPKSN